MNNREYAQCLREMADAVENGGESPSAFVGARTIESLRAGAVALDLLPAYDDKQQGEKARHVVSEPGVNTEHYGPELPLGFTPDTPREDINFPFVKHTPDDMQEPISKNEPPLGFAPREDTSPILKRPHNDLPEPDHKGAKSNKVPPLDKHGSRK